MRTTVSFFAALLVLSLGACTTADVPAGWQAESIDGFSVYRPGNWTVTQPEEGMLQMRPALTDENITIAVQNTPEATMDLAAYTDEYIASLDSSLKEEGLTHTVIASTGATLAGLPAHSLLLSFDGDRSVKALSVWTVKSGKVYTVTYAADPDSFDAKMSVMETMLRSAALQ